jgi:molybdenum storage protein
VGVSELMAMDLDTLPIDALVLELMTHAKHQKEIQIVSGLTPGNITKALQGEHVGTIIHAD